MSPDTSPEIAEVLRLRRKLEAREEVIRQLNRQLHGMPPGTAPPDPEEAPAVIEEYAYRARILDAEVARLRDEIEGEHAQRESLLGELQQVRDAAAQLQEQLGAAGAAAASTRGPLRRVASGVKRRLVK